MSSETMVEGHAHTTYGVKDYKSDLKSIWCPGCGDFGVLNSVYKALAKLQRAPEQVAVVSGIGCSSRLPGYVATYGFNAIHGRAVPIATGVKLANPELTVLAVGGDGDGFSIGGGHIPHGVRRNVDLTYVIMDNQVYGLTKGQYSPTTPMGDVSTSTTLGSIESPINPLLMCLSYGIGYLAQCFSSDTKMLTEMIADGIEYPGFALVNVISPCPTFRGHDQFKQIKEVAVNIEEEGHDPSSLEKALALVRRPDVMNCFGLIYREDKASYHVRLEKIRERSRARGVYEPAEVLKQFEV